MKNILIIAILVFCVNQIFGQSVNLESTIRIDTAKTELSVQRIEVSTSKFTLKYDYKATGSDVLGILIPKIWSNKNTTLSGMIVKIGDNYNNQFAFDSWLTKKIGKFNFMTEVGRMVSRASKPVDYAGVRLTANTFTVEAYLVERSTKGNYFLGWAAYHPEHAFIAAGKQDKQYWGIIGTKGLSRFGSLAFVNYQPETGNFWFKSQTGFGEINQQFFSQDTYTMATSYLCVPIFFYKHFSPIATKGTYALKIEGKRTANLQNYEVMMGKKIGEKGLGVAVGINSQYSKNLDLGPSFELYKAWKNTAGLCIVELRYDHVAKVCSAYLVLKY